MKARGLGLIAVVILMAAGTVSAMAAAALLSPDEINATFGTGKPFTATSRGGGKVYSFTFKADGSALQVTKGKSNGTTGTWRLTVKGYCTKWGKSAEHCYTVEKSGKQYAVRDAHGTLISTWSL